MIVPPSLAKKLSPLNPNEFGTDRELEQGRVDDADWDRLEAHRGSFHHVLLHRPNMIGADLRQGGLVDVAVEQGIFSGMILVESLWRRVTITGSRLDGVVAYSSQMSDVVFTGTRLDQANFRSVRMRNVEFNGVSLKDVDFAGASLRNVSFTDTDITGADFTGARLKNVDLRHARFDYLNGFAGLRGAIMTYAQILLLAPILARQAGITIEELIDEQK